MKLNTKAIFSMACSGFLFAASMNPAHTAEHTGPSYLVDDNSVPVNIHAQFATICMRIIEPWGPDSPMLNIASDPRGRKLIAFCWGGFPHSIDNVGAERALQYMPRIDMAFMLQQQPTATGAAWTPWVGVDSINLSSADLYREFNGSNPQREAAGLNDAGSAKAQFISAIKRLGDEGWSCDYKNDEQVDGEGKNWEHVHDRLVARCIGSEIHIN